MEENYLTISVICWPIRLTLTVHHLHLLHTQHPLLLLHPRLQLNQVHKHKTAIVNTTQAIRQIETHLNPSQHTKTRVESRLQTHNPLPPPLLPLLAHLPRSQLLLQPRTHRDLKRVSTTMRTSQLFSGDLRSLQTAFVSIRQRECTLQVLTQTSLCIVFARSQLRPDTPRRQCCSS